MLRFIFGRAATGKTSTVLNLIQKDVTAGKEAVLIIPEQFSFESEKAVLELLGDKLSKKVAVLSFTRLCDEVERFTGGICGTTLSESDKMILMCRAVNISSNQLKLWSKYKNSLGFSKAMLETINEFKLNSISAEELINASEFGFNLSLSAKLHDIGVIYNNFNMLLGERFIDPSDRLTKLYHKLENFNFFQNKTVYFDSFKNFTGQQFKIIDRIFSQSKDVYVSLSNNSENFKEFDVFENIRKTADKFKKCAKAHNVPIGENINLTQNFYKSRGIYNVEQLLCIGKNESNENDDSVTICRGATLYDEAEYTARTIRQIVRENPHIRYRDIAIIVRDTAPYEEAVLSACQKNNVSCFVDKRHPLSSFPPVSAALSAIDAASNISTEAILRFYKTGLGNIDFDSISLIENYTYIWNIEGKYWETEWDMNPEGFVSNEISDRNKELLKKINEIRQSAITPIIKFKNNFKGNTADRVKAIIKLFENCNAKAALITMKNLHKEKGEFAYADALCQSWDTFMSLLNNMVNCMGEANISTTEFTNILKSSISFATIGVTPQMLDEVTFGAADRIRPSRPKVAFILGANQNIFPRTITNTGILATNERNELISAGLEISDHSLTEALDEEFLIYSNVCCPTEKLYISYRSLDEEDKEISPASFVELISQNINCKKIEYPQSNDDFSIPETAESAFTQFCQLYSSNKSHATELFTVLDNIPEYQRRIEIIKSGYDKRDFTINKTTSEELFGNEIKISPSKLDVFMRCNFSFFCKYGLKARRLQPAEFNVMQRGTIVHYVLQRIFEKYGKKISQLDNQSINNIVDEYLKEYLDSIPGYRSVETARMRYLCFTISRSLKEVVLHLSKEFAQSDFEPQQCELKIGSSDAPYPEIPLSDNRKILLEGSVDRVDAWNGYIRIVDYKTGSRKFKLPDILVGQNMQMLIYLYSLCKNSIYSNNKPAGIFYMPSKRDLKDNKLRMDGLSALNENVVTAMEKSNNGEFVAPLKYTQKGELNAHYKNAFIEEADFDVIFSHIEKMIKKMGSTITNGEFSVNPIDGIDSPACKYCDFASVCGIEDKKCKTVPKMDNSEVIELLKEEAENGI